MKKVDFGSKYQFKADTNPAVGQYEVEASSKAIMNRSVAAKIVSNDNAYVRTVEASPEPGQYQVETVTFAQNMNKVDFGSKYQFKANSNPAPG